jgi:hypothetical protein
MDFKIPDIWGYVLAFFIFLLAAMLVFLGYLLGRFM